MNEWEFQLLEEKAPLISVPIPGGEVKVGDLVRLRPRKGGDIMDLALANKVAEIESIEQDYDGKVHLAVVLEDDPGKDLGVLRQPGHRFFFAPEEVEPLQLPKILIAGIGNIFLGDDGFGVEAIRQLAGRKFPEHVKVADYGIRSYDLAYALLDSYDVVILVDASPRGGTPGTLYVIEAQPDKDTAAPAPDAHSMNPVSVIQLAKSMGPISCRIFLVACEPATLGGEEGFMGLSEPVSAAIPEALKLIDGLVDRISERKEGTEWN